DFFLLASLKPGVFGRKLYELDSSNLGGHLPYHPIPCYNFPFRRREMGYDWQGQLDPLPRFSPKRSQNLTSSQKKPTASLGMKEFK
ncbi:hypothetical protein AVEN_176534-1, partial [Araneus ventricosus]